LLWFSEEYLEIDGMACKLDPLAIAEGMVVSTMNGLLQLGFQSFFKQ